MVGFHFHKNKGNNDLNRVPRVLSVHVGVSVLGIFVVGGN